MRGVPGDACEAATLDTHDPTTSLINAMVADSECPRLTRPSQDSLSHACPPDGRGRAEHAATGHRLQVQGAGPRSQPLGRGPGGGRQRRGARPETAPHADASSTPLRALGRRLQACREAGVQARRRAGVCALCASAATGACACHTSGPKPYDSSDARAPSLMRMRAWGCTERSLRVSTEKGACKVSV